MPATNLQLAVLAAAVQQAVAPGLIFAGGFGGFDGRGGVPSPAEPAGWAFGIWGVIYAGCLAFAVVQLAPRWRDHPALAGVRGPAIALFLGSTLWLLAARDGPLWLTVLVILAMLAAALLAMLRLARQPALPRALKLAAGWPLALYAGWLTAASFVNMVTVLPAQGPPLPPASIERLAIMAVAGAAITGLLVVRASRGALPYALAVAWALTGIVVANRGDGGSVAVMWAAAGAAALLLAALLAIRRARTHAPA